MAASARSRAFWVSRSFSAMRLLTVSALGYRMSGISATEDAQKDAEESVRTLMVINVVSSLAA
jgi:hypothetical protein